MQNYLDLAKKILETGQERKDRTGVGTISIFGEKLEFDLAKGFPAVTTKKLFLKGVIGELLWFLEGSTDERRLAELTYGQNRIFLNGNTTIWTANAKSYLGDDLYSISEVVDLGHIYGSAWRNFEGYDQIKKVIQSIKFDPSSRRHIVSAWNPSRLTAMALPPCHVLFQFYVANETLSCQMYQRSCDYVLGNPYNIASYAILTHLIARECQLKVGKLSMVYGDLHIYKDHIPGLMEQLSRTPYPSPQLIIDETFDLMEGLNNGFYLTDANKIFLSEYEYHPSIKFNMAV